MRQNQHAASSAQHSVVEAHAQPNPCHHERSERSAFRQFVRTVAGVFREIFDENAYARFLSRHGMTNSRESYALYLRESNTTRERRPRCC